MDIPTLIVLLGPTGVGKTELSLRMAEMFHTEILSSDSRQLYADLPIGTAAPTREQRIRVPHHFVGILQLTDYYSAAQYETEALALLERLFQKQEVILMTGGSMMYIDAVCRGIDDIPTISEEVRLRMQSRLSREGLESLCEELREKDPEYYAIVDHKNYKRVVHALEIIEQSGQTYTSLRSGRDKERPFRIVKIGLDRPREELFGRINRRVDAMLEEGLLEEVRKVYPYRRLNSLNTVGYKEMFRVLDGEWDLQFATERMKKNTRVYAKKQLTWFRRDPFIRWFHPGEENELFEYLKSLGL